MLEDLPMQQRPRPLGTSIAVGGSCTCGMVLVD
jgi:hypothetical protein